MDERKWSIPRGVLHSLPRQMTSMSISVETCLSSPRKSFGDNHSPRPRRTISSGQFPLRPFTFCSSPKMKRKIESSASGRNLTLSKEETRRILATWINLTKTTESTRGLGKKMLSHVFKEKPSLMPLFKNGSMRSAAPFSGCPISSSRSFMESPCFDMHCLLFVTGLGNMIEALCTPTSDDPEMIKAMELIRNKGRQHAHMPGVSFDAHNWLLIKGAILSAVRPSNDKDFNAWNKILMFIIMEMKDGFLSAVKRKNTREEETTNSLPPSPSPAAVRSLRNNSKYSSSETSSGYLSESDDVIL